MTRKRELVADRHVRRHAAAVAHGVALREIERARPEVERGLLELRTVRQVAYRAAERAGAVQGALRSEQHLDTLHVIEREVDVDRYVADIRGHGVAAVVADDVRLVDRREAQAAHDDLVRRSLALIDDVEPGYVAAELSEIGDLARFQHLAVERRDVDRDVLDVLLAPRGGDDDLFDRDLIVLRERGNRQRGRCEHPRDGHRELRPLQRQARSAPRFQSITLVHDVSPSARPRTAPRKTAPKWCGGECGHNTRAADTAAVRKSQYRAYARLKTR